MGEAMRTSKSITLSENEVLLLRRILYETRLKVAEGSNYFSVKVPLRFSLPEIYELRDIERKLCAVNWVDQDQ
jgi:hypothetical protein